MSNLARVRSIGVHRAEGLNEECKHYHMFHNWTDAEAFIKRAAQTAPSDGSCHKCDVTVDWGSPAHRSFRWHFDLRAEHATAPSPLADDLKQELTFHSGRAHDGRLTREEYKQIRSCALPDSAHSLAARDHWFATLLDECSFADDPRAIKSCAEIQVGQPYTIAGEGILFILEVDPARNAVRAQGHGPPSTNPFQYWFPLSRVVRHCSAKDVTAAHYEARVRNVACTDTDCWCRQFQDEAIA